MRKEVNLCLRVAGELCKKEKSVRAKREFHDEIDLERMEKVPNFLVLVRVILTDPAERPRVKRA